jgi:hypothetical protein
MDELSGTPTSLTQLHVPEHEHLYVVIIKTPHFGRCAVGEPCLRGDLARRVTAHHERTGA